MTKHSTSITLAFVLALLLSACQGASLNGSSNELKASGTISAAEVKVAAQLSGAVAEVMVEEGASVKAGDTLFRLDDTLLQAQYEQASAAVNLAEAGVNTARAQYELTLNAARLQDQQNRAAAWQSTQPAEFSLPVWYFEISEEISSAKDEVSAAEENLQTEKAKLQKLLESTVYKDFIAAEKRIGEAQAAFLIAQQILAQAKAAQDNVNLESYAQEQFDAAKAELDAAQSTYNRMLSTQEAIDILEARGRVAVAQARYDAALDRLTLLRTGENSLQVKVAESGLKQAEAALAQAQSAVKVIEVQLEKIVVKAPVSGVILARNIQPGEVVSPGSTVFVIGQLEEVELIVYIPETQYGKVNLGDQVSITVDSFPAETFTGTVVHISDKAEFTPRNVQTVEGRSATVYAIKLSVPNPDLKLKPGMPTDVTFVIGK